MSRINVDPIDQLAAAGMAVLAVGLAGQFSIFVALIAVGLALLVLAIAIALVRREAA